MEFQLSYLKSQKMTMLKCYTQYISKFGKHSGGHRTGKGQFVFIQIPKKGNAKVCSNYWTAELISHASKVMLKFFKAGYSSMWAKNFQMYKLGFEEAEEPEIKLPIYNGSWRKQGCSRRASNSVSLTTLMCFRVDHKKLWKNLKDMGIPDYLTCLLRHLYTG